MAGHYVKLCNSDDVGKVSNAFLTAIEMSFITNPMPSGNIPQAEAIRRFDLCDRIFTNLCGDFKWSILKAIDILPTYLKCELDGVPYDPGTIRDTWCAETVDKVHDVPKLADVPIVGVPDTSNVDDDPVWNNFGSD